MKKRLLVLGMVACLLGLTACGNEASVAEASISAEEVESVASYYIEGISELATLRASNVDNYELAMDSMRQQDEEFAAAIDAATSNYVTAIEDLGAYKGLVSVSYTEEKGNIEINATIEGSNLNPKGEARTAEVILELDSNTSLKSMLTNVNYTFVEMMTTAGLNTLLGIGTVFMVLIILMILISCFALINKAETAIANKKAGKKAEAAKADSVDNAVNQITANEEAADDTELIAVIAAAIAASEGAASTDGYVVRSIRRRY